MLIKSIKLVNFRNYVDSIFEFNNESNQLIAPNGTGKTNVLEGIIVCSCGKSNKGATDKELVRFGEKFYRIECEYISGGRDKKIVITSDTNKKKITINDVSIKKTSQLIGELAVVNFSPDDLAIIKGSPSLRRKLVDSILCQIDSKYLFAINRYKKILIQKNKLYKRKGISIEELKTWNEGLLEHGKTIYEKRVEYIKKLEKTASLKYKDMLSAKLNFVYKSDFEKIDIGKLNSYIEKEIIMKQSLIGVQRDDIEILVDGKLAKNYSSQGQIRSIVIAIKLAEIDILEKRFEETPVLLLDDVMSELDEERRAYIAGHIKNVQTIITCTDGGGESCIFLKENGEQKDGIA